MKYRYFLSFIFLLTACIDTIPERKEVKNMNGTIHLSFEEAEFFYKGEVYYLNDESNLLTKIIQNERKNNNSFNINKDICLNGYIRNKEQNKGNGFGALGKYNLSIVVKGIC